MTMKPSCPRRIALALPLLALLASLAAAQAPLVIDFQGKLVFAGNESLVTGSRSINFSIYDAASGGAPLWTETQTVSLSNGIFNALLGGSVSLATVPFSRALWLQLAVAGETLTPRLNFTKSPFALSLSGRVWLNGSNIYFNGTVQGLNATFIYTQIAYVNGTPVQRLLVSGASCDGQDGKFLTHLYPWPTALTVTPTSSPVTNNTLGLPNATIVDLVTGDCEPTAGPADCSIVWGTSSCGFSSGPCSLAVTCPVAKPFAVGGGVDCRPGSDLYIDLLQTSCPATGGACIPASEGPNVTNTQWFGRCWMDELISIEYSLRWDHGSPFRNPGEEAAWSVSSASASNDIDVWAVCCPKNNYG
jgi:hypothetical protein